MRRVGDREPLAGDGVAEIVVVVVVVLDVVVVVVVLDERRAKEEAVARIEDGCVGMGRQEAEGVISAAVLNIIIISYWEITDGFIADGFGVSAKIYESDEESGEWVIHLGVEDDGRSQLEPGFGNAFESG